MAANPPHRGCPSRVPSRERRAGQSRTRRYICQAKALGPTGDPRCPEKQRTVSLGRSPRQIIRTLSVHPHPEGPSAAALSTVVLPGRLGLPAGGKDQSASTESAMTRMCEGWLAPERWITLSSLSRFSPDGIRGIPRVVLGRLTAK